MIVCTSNNYAQYQDDYSYLFKVIERKQQKNVQKYCPNSILAKTSKATIYYHTNAVDPKKPNLVLLHGMGLDAKTNWSKQIKTFTKNFNVFIPDLVYFGKSTSDTSNFSVEFQAQQIHEAVCQHFGNTAKLNIVGFSYGGLTAAIFNYLYSFKINKLVIADGPVKFFTEAMADSIASRNKVPKFTNVIVPETNDQLKVTFKLSVSKQIHVPNFLKKKIIRFFFLKYKKYRHAQMNYLLNNKEFYNTCNYSLDKTNTLLIWGEKDGVIPISVGYQLNQQFPKTTKLMVFKKAKHDAHFRNAKQFNKIITLFLN